MQVTDIKLSKGIMHIHTSGDVWETTWADNGFLYTISDDSAGFLPHDNETSEIISSSLNFNIVYEADYEKVKGKVVNHMLDYGGQGVFKPERNSDGCCWKAIDIACINGILYMTVARHNYGLFSGDGFKRQTSQNASIIKSYDYGLTWERPADENYSRPMFYGGKFGAPSFIDYGQNHSWYAHNSDKYVYAISNNGYWDCGDSMVLGRVPGSRLSSLDALDWEYYKGGDGMSDESWTKKLMESAYILENPGRCSMTGVQYIKPLDRYIMIQWYYPYGGGQNHKPAMEQGLKYASEETVWDFYIADYPWGPWNKIKSFKFVPYGYYNPCIISKSISDDGKSFLIFTNGDFNSSGEREEDRLYRLTTMKCQLVVE